MTKDDLKFLVRDLTAPETIVAVVIVAAVLAVAVVSTVLRYIAAGTP